MKDEQQKKQMAMVRTKMSHTVSSGHCVQYSHSRSFRTPLLKILDNSVSVVLSETGDDCSLVSLEEHAIFCQAKTHGEKFGKQI